jgi:hypothetical protein
VLLEGKDEVKVGDGDGDGDGDGLMGDGMQMECRWRGAAQVRESVSSGRGTL